MYTVSVPALLVKCKCALIYTVNSRLQVQEGLGVNSMHFLMFFVFWVFFGGVGEFGILGEIPSQEIAGNNTGLYKWPIIIIIHLFLILFTRPKEGWMQYWIWTCPAFLELV